LHGLVMLNNSCRIRVMDMTEQENHQMIQRAHEEWIKMLQMKK